jgi:hypothetical protein
MQRLELGTPRVGDALRGMVHLSHLDLSLPDETPQKHTVVLDVEPSAQLSESLHVHTALRSRCLANACADLAKMAFPQWPLLQHLDVVGTSDRDSQGDHDGVPILQNGAPAPPDGSSAAGLHSIALLSKLSCLCVGTGMPCDAEMDAHSLVIAALPRLRRLELCNVSECDWPSHGMVAPGLAHAHALTALRLCMSEDVPLVAANEGSNLAQLQQLQLTDMMCPNGVNAPGDWRNVTESVLRLTQLTSLMWAKNTPADAHFNSLMQVFEGVTKLQRLQELSITGGISAQKRCCRGCPRSRWLYGT